MKHKVSKRPADGMERNQKGEAAADKITLRYAGKTVDDAQAEWIRQAELGGKSAT